MVFDFKRNILPEIKQLSFDLSIQRLHYPAIEMMQESLVWAIA